MTGPAAFGPPDWITAWVEHAPAGTALDLGAGAGNSTIWLSDLGYEVVAIERDPAGLEELRRLERSRERLQVVNADLAELEVEPERYGLILALASLHFLRPSELWPLADRLQRGLRPGGLLLAEVFSVDDPGCSWYREQEIEEIEPNTFRRQEGVGWIHYFEREELTRVFGRLEAHFNEQVRTSDPAADPPYRTGLRFVGRKSGEGW